MDPITTAITTALLTSASAGIGDVSKKAIVDAYEGLKSLLKRWFAGKPAAQEALQKIEDAPDSPNRAKALSDQIVALGAHNDSELLAAVDLLVKRLTAAGGGRANVMVAHGEGIAQAAGGSTATVTYSKPSDK